jgi:pyruvate/2-oxoglutarate dehydrogenase complex dihydrolipoamide acyltransferase (E2) component
VSVAVTPVKIPKLGVGMVEGTLSVWLVADGDDVGVGAPVYVLETDKLENEVESPAAGRISILKAADATYSVGTLVAEIS